jgi:YD repeat-containing protein
VIVSYWGRAGDTSAWEYVENVVDANGQDYNIGGGYYYIDEVRMYPVGARMTTYTYDPFYKQPTSVMKPDNQVEYYRYDSFGRLTDVRDENGNLLKENQYHYKP